MQENQTIINNDVFEANAQSAVTPQPVYDNPKTNNFLLILLSVLLFVAVSIAGFFAYQTQQLVKELQMVSFDSKETIEPSIEPVATTDPTANWKTYTNTKIGATIKYPQNWVLKEASNGISVDFNTMTLSPKIVDQNQVNYYFNFQLEDPTNFQAWSNDVSSKKLTPLKINGMTFDRIISADMFYSLNYIYKSLDGKIYRFYLGPYTESESSTVLDETVIQILSTFKIVK